MGWQDREYASEEGYQRAVGRPLLRLPGHIRMSTIIIVANVAIFLLQSISGPRPDLSPLVSIGAMETSAVLHGQVWRLITSQYLHANTWHIFVNMLGLFFLGRYMEQAIGSGRFLAFYTVCGVIGNLFYMLLNLVGWLPPGSAIGASGCVLGVLGACAVLFPGINLIIYFFPMRIRTAVVLFLALYVMNLLNRGLNAGGDAAHLAGLLAGAAYAFRKQGGLRSRHLQGLRRTARRRGPGAWQHKLEDEARVNEQVDAILAKIHHHGIASLTDREKQILSEASRQQQQEEEQYGRIDRL